jgi:hypothetical protein
LHFWVYAYRETPRCAIIRSACPFAVSVDESRPAQVVLVTGR